MTTEAIHSLQPTSHPVPEATGAVIDVCSFSEFKIGEEIGSGAFGKVVKAKHDKYNDVAIKILCEDSRNYEAVLKEATKMRRLCTYPSIMCVHCVTRFSGQNRFGIAMEWMKFGNLKDFQQKKIKEFPWALRMRMLKEISEGMYYLHDENIIHRDLKAENIFVQETLSVKIGDFGLSKSMQSVMNFETGGTPSHMPPEYFNSKQHPNKEWDVYSFGILLYEVASRKTAFEEIGSDLDRLMFCVVKNNDRPDICDSYPDFVKELMKKCWDANPDNRPNFKDIKQKIRNAYEMKYEMSILEAIIKVLTHLKDQQCITELDARMSNLSTTISGKQTENQGGSSELVTANEANKKTATMNQLFDEKNDKFPQTATIVNSAVPQSTGRLIPVNPITELHRENTVQPSTRGSITATLSSVSHQLAPMSPRQPVSVNLSTNSLQIKNGDVKLNDDDKQCVVEYLIKDNFKKLARKFGLKPGQISNIEMNNDSYNDRVYELIEKWERMNGRRTRKQLCECLWDVDRTIIDELNKF